MRVAETIASLGGVATTGELLRRGHEHEFIRMAVYYGKIQRIRRGWFGSLDLPDDVVRALRVGGRLACVSALAFHGIVDGGRVLHVAVAKNASRLRLPTWQVVLHWGDTASDGSRLALSIEDAWDQAWRCHGGLLAVSETEQESLACSRATLAQGLRAEARPGSG